MHSACVPSAARAARAALGVFVMQPGRVGEHNRALVAARSDRAAEAERSSVLFKMAELLLGPLLFIIFINELVDISTDNIKLYLFADDAKMYCHIRDTDDIDSL